MDPKEKKVKEEELNVEETHNPAEDQPQNEQAEGTAPLTHEEELEKELEKVQQIAHESDIRDLCDSAENGYRNEHRQSGDRGRSPPSPKRIESLTAQKSWSEIFHCFRH